HWSPLESVSPEAQLSPDENITPEVPFYSDSQTSAEPKPQGENEEWQSFREEATLNVKEEGEAAALPVPQEEDDNQNQETFSSSQQWEEQPSEEPVYPDMDRLLQQSQDAFRRSLRRQLHAVRQELREFRRDHTEMMDSLLTLHREHIIVEEQRNEILSQLVTTVNATILLAERLILGKPDQSFEIIVRSPNVDEEDGFVWPLYSLKDEKYAVLKLSGSEVHQKLSMRNCQFWNFFFPSLLKLVK
ncbi:hypothetical protein XELAEV_180426931mg, partial [Xenopus laevis]